MSDNYNAKRLANNTLLLYGRMLITMWLNLWATRLMLQNLGATDMGIYGVIGSIVGLFTIFSHALTQAGSRYIAFEIGKQEQKNTKIIFITIEHIVIVLTLIFTILLEIFGPLAITQHWINIPSGYEEETLWAFQGVVITFVCSLLIIPYQSLITAYEKMNFFAITNIFQITATCITTYLLLYANKHRLSLYSGGIALVSITVLAIYYFYCRKKFSTCRYSLIYNKEKTYDILRFIGTTACGSTIDIGVSQGIVFIINWTFGVTINAVYTISLQVKNMILAVSNGLSKAIQPQITKTYAEGNYHIYKQLTYSGSKTQMYLISFVMMPFLFRTEQIMNLWLGEGMVPDYAIFFAQCAVFLSLCYSAFGPISTAVIATGRLKRFLLIPSTISLMVLPLLYFISEYTINPKYAIITIVAFDIFCCFIRVTIATKVSPLEINGVLHNVILPYISTTLPAIIIYYYFSKSCNNTLIGLLAFCILSSFVYALAIYTIGINKQERAIVNKYLFQNNRK